jgi:CheY-like chemotaxis protein
VDPLAQFRVLVVDESEAFLTSTVRWIDSRPDLHVIGTATSGTEALLAVDRLSPDLVIVEAVLPGVDGFRLTRAIKQRPEAPFVVVVTFHASQAARDEARAAGADAFLAKADFTDGLDLILGDWAEQRAARNGETRSPTKRARRGSRTAPDP